MQFYRKKLNSKKGNVKNENVKNKTLININDKTIIGYNSHRSKRNNKKYQLHAEIDAIRKLNKIMKMKYIRNIEVDLVVIRYEKNEITNSTHCFNCCKELSKIISL